MQINGIQSPLAASVNAAADTSTGGALAAKITKAAQNIQNPKQAAKLRQACQDMEAVFLNLLLSKMRETVPKDTLFGDSSEENIMRSMLDNEMSKNMAKAGGIGLADMLYRQLSPTVVSKEKTK
ncbi:Hypothetical protein LUCI_4536 [Lucifera butyrica]|uniref:Flagellar protein FlgJ N-terminal domain-containing protein n=1 Tax=Lucifera butyrica TaxID=1351585 RepID=A0A498R957_9FIRM|nr:rod-binding protein [Lucifera butyrica]VBB09246.1 Hypothetical protein LUCI_4536 [Lucifera butyrica]